MSADPKLREVVKDQERFRSTFSPAEFKASIDFVVKRIDGNLELFTHKFPSASSVNLIYEPVENASAVHASDWTSGFWTGMIWLAYELTGDPKYRHAGDIQVESFMQRFDDRAILNHHDIGFLYSPSCVASYELTGNETAKQTALDAAKLLAMRFREKAGIIQVRGHLDDTTHHERGVFIIDCSMNVPLLQWATQLTGDSTYSDKAHRHIKNVAKYMVRPDGSTHQHFHIDVDTGEPVKGWTGQGYGTDEACWSRGQAWALYGLAMSYSYTRDQELIESAKSVANYFLNRLPEDLVCNWDLIFLENDGQRDSSAAAIAVCGLLELAKHLPVLDADRPLYERAALAILESLAVHYATNNLPESNGILQHAVYAFKYGRGVDECCIWGDYFYMEALVRVLKDWKPYW
ncbi:glycoside hydrolase family 88 protein [Paenibacillus phytorum]|nr:glycoside hydrolase family 88 protein [Paenibacillus phytorum]